MVFETKHLIHSYSEIIEISLLNSSHADDTSKAFPTGDAALPVFKIGCPAIDRLCFKRIDLDIITIEFLLEKQLDSHIHDFEHPVSLNFYSI